MIIAGVEIIACPHCKLFYQKPIIASFNTFGAEYYSDGYVDGLMIPKFVSMVKCRKCNAFFSTKEAVKIGEMIQDEDSEIFPAEWKKAIKLQDYKIKIKELEEALDSEFCNNRKTEIEVRTMLLQSYNHAWRHEFNLNNSHLEHPGFVENIRRLLDLHKDGASQESFLYFAELYREMGEFDSCIQLLDEMKTDKKNLIDAKENIYSHAKLKDARVINFSATAVKREYKCNDCGHSLILFDLDKLPTLQDYKYFRCKTENRVFNAPVKKRNPAPYYSSNIFRRLFRSEKFYREYIPIRQIICPYCNGKNTEPFSLSQKCIQCNKGNYKPAKWFEN